jgi:hypothetical protein
MCFAQLVVEPRSSTEFVAAIADFKAKLEDPAYNGAVFFAVCRGKVSEGLDFANRAGRAVIVTGLPYPSLFDPKVRLKRNFLDEAPKVPGLQQLSGDQWYDQQAVRAVNQAIGRVIRHCKDYGAIILADARFADEAVTTQLSRWVRPYARTFQNFDKITHELVHFFANASTAYPVNGGHEMEQCLASVNQSEGVGFPQQGSSTVGAAQGGLVPPKRFHASLSAIQAHGRDEWLDSFYTAEQPDEHSCRAFMPLSLSNGPARRTVDQRAAKPITGPASKLLSLLKKSTVVAANPCGGSAAAAAATAVVTPDRSTSRRLRLSRVSPPRSREVIHIEVDSNTSLADRLIAASPQRTQTGQAGRSVSLKRSPFHRQGGVSAAAAPVTPHRNQTIAQHPAVQCSALALPSLASVVSAAASNKRTKFDRRIEPILID